MRSNRFSKYQSSTLATTARFTITALLTLLVAFLAPNQASAASPSAEATLHITVIVVPTIGSNQEMTVQPSSAQTGGIVYNLQPNENGEEQRASVSEDLPPQERQRDVQENSGAEDRAPAVLRGTTFVTQ